MPKSQALLSTDQRGDDDLARIRLITLPDVGPPFDDDPAAKAMAAADSLRDDDPADRQPPGTRAPRPVGAQASSAHPAGTGGADGEWARRFAELLTEALSGARPVRQILPWTSRRARVQLPALMPLFSGGQRPRVLRVIATRPARDVIEMTVVAGVGARTRALAVRLQRAEPAERPARHGQPGTRPGKAPAPGTTATAKPRWLCTDIEAA